VHESPRTVHTTDDVGHAGLVAAKGSQVRGVGIRVPGERADATGVVLGALFGQETQTAMARSLKLAMRPE
jgi:hypothetical protein